MNTFSAHYDAPNFPSARASGSTLAPAQPPIQNRAQRESITNPLNMSFASVRRAEASLRDAQHAQTRPGTAGPLGRSGSGGAFGMSQSASAQSMRVSNKQPAWITHDREVLRFYAYFQEPIVEYGFKSSTFTKQRTRKCVVLYFLADSTISIDEPKTKNSGLTQGRFMKRTRVKRRDGSVFQPGDFEIGTHVEIFKRDFQIVDADTSTRSYFERELGVSLAPAIEYPVDGYDQSRARMETVYLDRPPMAPSLKNTTSRGSLNESVMTDAKVLRFFCAYEDDRRDGEKRDYTLHYFLADDTIEVKEKFTEGTHPFPHLLRRSVLPRDALEPPDNPIEEYAKGTDRVTWEDLRCGEALSVYGRPLLLLSCDGATERWYSSRGMVQMPMQLAASDNKQQLRKLPPYNGFGSEDDVYAMGLSLQPKTSANQQEDYSRFMTAENKVLRFNCALENCSESDAQRNLVVNYFLADDTISVYEPPVRNSGIVGGTFLMRTRYKKYIPTEGRPLARGSVRPRGGVLSRWLRPTDFKPNSVVTFEMASTGTILYSFMIGSCDEFTRKTVDAGSLEYPQSHLALTLTQLAEKLCAARIQVRSFFADCDPVGVGRVPEGEFRECLRNLEKKAAQTDAAVAFRRTLTDDELAEICWEYSAHDTGGEVEVFWPDFVDALVLAAPLPRLPEAGGREEKKNVENMLLKLLRHQFLKQMEGSGRLRDAFRSTDDTGAGCVSASSWFQVLRKHRFHGILTKQNAEALRRKYSRDDPESQAPDALSLDYHALCDSIFPGDFGSYVSRLLLVLSDASNVANATTIEHPEIERRQAGRAGAASKRDRAAKERALVDSMRGEDKKKTVAHELRSANTLRRDEGGDLIRQLGKATMAFSSAFGRNHRRKMLRKHFMSFDVANTGMINKHEFATSLARVVDQGFCDFDKRDSDLIVNFVFPQAHTRHNYDQLQTLLIARDAHGLVKLRNLVDGVASDPSLAFDSSKIEALDAYGESGAGKTLPGGMHDDE